MPSPTDFPARGKVTSVRPDGTVVFEPTGSTYEFHLAPVGGKYEGPVNVPVSVYLRAVARKLWTVPSGGSWVSPIVGSPRTIQGRVRYADERTVVLHAGASFVIELPSADVAIDFTHGPLREGGMANVVALPGATIELAKEPVATA